MLIATLSFSGMHATISMSARTYIRSRLRSSATFSVWWHCFHFYPARTSAIEDEPDRPPSRACRPKYRINDRLLLRDFDYASGEVIALSFAAPIFATLLAIFFFRETVGITRWTAIFLGFAGTIVILRPGYEAITLGPVLALMAAMTWGSAVIIIKKKQDGLSVTITAYMVLFMTPLSLAPALFVWEWPSWEQLAWLALIGSFGTAGHLTMNVAIKLAPTNVVMPIDFVRLIWVAIIGYFIFAEIPDIFVWIGGAMIFASGIWIAHAENQRRRETTEDTDD